MTDDLALDRGGDVGGEAVPATTYVGRGAGSPSELTIDVALGRDVTCHLALLPRAAIVEVIAHHGPGPGPGTDQLELVDRLLADAAPVDALVAYAAATARYAVAGRGRLAAVDTALRALDLVEALGLDPAADELDGPVAVWQATSYEAALALAQLPRSARAAAVEVRAAVAAIAARLRTRGDSVTVARMADLVDMWPRSVDDHPIVGDTTIADLLAQAARFVADQEDADLRGPILVHRGAGDQPPEPILLHLDVAPLVARGLLDPGTPVRVQPVGRSTDDAWLVSVRVRQPVADALATVHQVWRRHTGDGTHPAGPDGTAELVLAYAGLQASTDLPYRLDQFLKDTASKSPALPHLLDVACLVTHDTGASATSAGFGLRPEVDGHRLELRTIIPHRSDPGPGSASLALFLRDGPSPLVRAGGALPIAARVLELRSGWLAGSTDRREDQLLRKLARELRAAGSKDLAASLEREGAVYQASEGTDLAALAVLTAQVESSAAALARELTAAVAARDEGEARRLSAELWQTRSYLSAMPR